MKKITTKNGHKINLKDFITGGEYEKIEDIFLVRKDKTDENLIRKGTDLAIEMITISVDGKTENVLQEIKSLPSADYLEVVSQVKEIKEGQSEQKKRK